MYKINKFKNIFRVIFPLSTVYARVLNTFENVSEWNCKLVFYGNKPRHASLCENESILFIEFFINKNRF